MITYEQALKDRTFLWDIASAADMIGGYVDQHDLEDLLKNPTKATARRCLVDHCQYWFQWGTDVYGNYERTLAANPDYAEQLAILKERYDA